MARLVTSEILLRSTVVKPGLAILLLPIDHQFFQVLALIVNGIIAIDVSLEYYS